MELKQLLRNPLLQAAMVLEVGLWPIIGALVAQYGFDYPPCELCLYQRYPYFAILLLAGYAFAKPERSQIMLVLAASLCLISAAIGLFHTGVELDWWQYHSGCVPEAGQAGSLDDLRASISRAPLVSCDQAMVYLLGLSMAAWNVIYGACAALGLMAVRNLVKEPL